MAFFYCKIQLCVWTFSILIIIFTDSVSYFHKMIMFTSLVGILNQSIMGGKYSHILLYRAH